jgi:hypothetical protein
MRELELPEAYVLWREELRTGSALTVVVLTACVLYTSSNSSGVKCNRACHLCTFRALLSVSISVKAKYCSLGIPAFIANSRLLFEYTAQLQGTLPSQGTEFTIQFCKAIML